MRGRMHAVESSECDDLAVTAGECRTHRAHVISSESRPSALSSLAAHVSNVGRIVAAEEMHRVNAARRIAGVADKVIDRESVADQVLDDQSRHLFRSPFNADARITLAVDRERPQHASVSADTRVEIGEMFGEPRASFAGSSAPTRASVGRCQSR
jgi:hypothetical protein